MSGIHKFPVYRMGLYQDPSEAPKARVDPLQNLLEWIEGELKQSYDITNAASASSKDRFIPIGRVELHFQKNRSEIATDLLRAIFPGENHELPIRPQDLTRTCCRVFCILALIGQTRFIASFCQNPNLWDDRLPLIPFRDGTPPLHFPSDTSRPDFFDQFNEEQWKFCAPTLYGLMGVRFEKSSILPIVTLGQAGGGSTSTVYRAVIHGEHDEIVCIVSQQAVQLGADHLRNLEKRHVSQSLLCCQKLYEA